jgi:hypothetical protein
MKDLIRNLSLELQWAFYDKAVRNVQVAKKYVSVAMKYDSDQYTIEKAIDHIESKYEDIVHTVSETKDNKLHIYFKDKETPYKIAHAMKDIAKTWKEK